MTRASAVILGFAALAMAPVRAADTVTQAEVVVRAVYRTHFAKGQRWDITLESERARFAPALLRMLDEDRIAQKATPGEIVGLDYDPLTGGQDDAERFVVGNARIDQGEALVPVEIWLAASRGDTLTIRLALVEGRWRISNIHDGTADLVDTLEALKAERSPRR